MGAEGGREEIQMGVEVFAFVEAGTRDHAAVLVDDLEEGGRAVLAVEPAVRRSVVLPKLADVLDLPAADGVGRFFARAGRHEACAQSPAADRRPVDGEVMAAQRFGSGARWLPPEAAGRQKAARRLAQAAREEA